MGNADGRFGMMRVAIVWCRRQDWKDLDYSSGDSLFPMLLKDSQFEEISEEDYSFLHANWHTFATKHQNYTFYPMLLVQNPTFFPSTALIDVRQTIKKLEDEETNRKKKALEKAAKTKQTKLAKDKEKYEQLKKKFETEK